MKAFVTGGSGYIGKDLLTYLVEHHGDTVVALSRSQNSDRILTDCVAAAAPPDVDSASHIYLSIVRGDVNSSNKLFQQWMQGCDVVYHLASRLPLLSDSWDLQLKETVEGTRNVVTAAKAANVRKVVVVSSASALMSHTKGVSGVPENAARDPPSYLLYAKAKSMAEDVALQAATTAFSVVIVRPPFVHGPRDTTVLSSIKYYLEAGSLTFSTPEGYLVSTVNVRNLTQGIRLAATHGRSGNAYHFQDRESPMPAREFFTRYASCLPGLEVQVAKLAAGRSYSPTPGWLLSNLIAWLPQPLRSSVRHKLYASREVFLIFNYSLSVSSAQTEQELGYEPLLSFQDSMTLTAQSFADNPLDLLPSYMLR